MTTDLLMEVVNDPPCKETLMWALKHLSELAPQLSQVLEVPSNSAKRNMNRDWRTGRRQTAAKI